MKPNRHNSHKNYLYHHDYSHDIEKCIQLQDKIEEFIYHGQLNKFLHKASPYLLELRWG